MNAKCHICGMSLGSALTCYSCMLKQGAVGAVQQPWAAHYCQDCAQGVNSQQWLMQFNKCTNCYISQMARQAHPAPVPAPAPPQPALAMYVARDGYFKQFFTQRTGHDWPKGGQPAPGNGSIGWEEMIFGVMAEFMDLMLEIGPFALRQRIEEEDKVRAEEEENPF